MALTPNIQLSQASALAIYNYPSAEVDVSQARILSVSVSDPTPVDVSQVRVLAIVKTRTATINARNFTFRLDGHDFYVLRLGDDATLVYDLTTGTWQTWTSADLDFWRANTGLNWDGISGKTLTDGGYKTNVVVGDDSTGRLYILDPELGRDESTRDTLSDETYPRKLVGGLPMRNRDTQQVGAAYVTADLGRPSITGATIKLRSSDDNGRTWADHGEVEIESGNYSQEIVWRSLGLLRAPGRIFELSDDGATIRIDSLDIR